MSKVKLILSRGQEKAQREGDILEDPKAREAFWELEKGKWCSLQVEGVGGQGCVV